MSGSWVTSSTVMPVRPSSWNSAITSTLVRESRLPVGSSARMTRGPVDQRPGDGDPLLLAARHLVGVVVEPIAQPDPLQRLAGPLVPLGGGDPGVEQRQLDVLQRRGARQQVEVLEDEADRLVAEVRQLVVGEAGDVLPLQQVAAGGGAVEAAEQVHQRRLARARGPHDGDELALRDLERDAAERRQLDVAHPVDLGDVLQLDQGGLGHLVPPLEPAAHGGGHAAGRPHRVGDDHVAGARARPPPPR